MEPSASTSSLDAVLNFIQSAAADFEIDGKHLQSFLATRNSQYLVKEDADIRLLFLGHIAVCFVVESDPVSAKTMKFLIDFECKTLLKIVDEAAGFGIFAAKAQPNVDLLRIRCDFICRHILSHKAPNFLLPVLGRKVVPFLVASGVFFGLDFGFGELRNMKESLVALQTFRSHRPLQDSLQLFLSQCLISNDKGLFSLFALFLPHFRAASDETIEKLTTLLCSAPQSPLEPTLYFKKLILLIKERFLAANFMHDFEAPVYANVLAKAFEESIVDPVEFIGAYSLNWLTSQEAHSSRALVDLGFESFLSCTKILFHLLKVASCRAFWLSRLRNTFFFSALTYFVVSVWSCEAVEAQIAKDLLLFLAQDDVCGGEEGFCACVFQIFCHFCGLSLNAVEFQVVFQENFLVGSGEPSIVALLKTDSRVNSREDLALSEIVHRFLAVASQNPDFVLKMYSKLCKLAAPAEESQASARSQVLLLLAEKIQSLDLSTHQLLLFVAATLQMSCEDSSKVSAADDSELLPIATALLVALINKKTSCAEEFSPGEAKVLDEIYLVLQHSLPHFSDLQTLLQNQQPSNENSTFTHAIEKEPDSEEMLRRSLSEIHRMLHPTTEIPLIANAIVELKTFLQRHQSFFKCHSDLLASSFSMLLDLLAFEDSFVYLNAIGTLSCFVYAFHDTCLSKCLEALLLADNSPLSSFASKQRLCELFARIIKDFGDFFSAYSDSFFNCLLALLKQCEQSASSCENCVEEHKNIMLLKCGILSLISLIYENSPYSMSMLTDDIFSICMVYLESSSELLPVKAACLAILKFMISGANRRIFDFLTVSQLEGLLVKVEIYTYHSDDVLKMNALDIIYQLERILCKL